MAHGVLLREKRDEILRIAAKYGVRNVRVFGSVARGDIGGQSDLDLVFIVDTQERFPERCRRFYEALEPKVGMDILVYTPDEFEAMRHGHFLRHALLDGKVIYEA